MKKFFLYLLAALLPLAVIYYSFFTLDSQPIPQQEILTAFERTSSEPVELTLTPVDERTFRFEYSSFDGETVLGQISYPAQAKDQYPLLIGIHAMGRSFPRWWVDSLKGRATVTHVNKITQLAHQKGYAVIAIDARYHGSRKDPNKTLRSIMTAMTFLGDKADYVDMIHHTVLDHRVLLDWIVQQPQFDTNNIHVAGYSMGGQLSLLLASVDDRISNVAAIVPPHIDDRLALVAPKNLVDRLHHHKVWLFTAKDDENATMEDNQMLFRTISSPNKKLLEYNGNHILPPEYVDALADWFEV